MRAYLERLRSEGRLRVIEREVDGRNELAAITQASQRESDAALLFRSVRGSRYPVVTNVFGSRPRLIELIGAADGSFCARWAKLMRAPAPPPKPVAEPDDLHDVRIRDLPHITYFEQD